MKDKDTQLILEAYSDLTSNEKLRLATAAAAQGKGPMVDNSLPARVEFNDSNAAGRKLPRIYENEFMNGDTHMAIDMTGFDEQGEDIAGYVVGVDFNWGEGDHGAFVEEVMITRVESFDESTGDPIDVSGNKPLTDMLWNVIAGELVGEHEKYVDSITAYS